MEGRQTGEIGTLGLNDSSQEAWHLPLPAVPPLVLQPSTPKHLFKGKILEQEEHTTFLTPQLPGRQPGALKS